MYACFKGIDKRVLREALAFWEGCCEPSRDKCPAPTYQSRSVCPWGAILWALTTDDYVLMPGSAVSVVRVLRQFGQHEMADFLVNNHRFDVINAFMAKFDAGKVKDVRRAMGLN